MPINFACPHCGKQTTVADQYAGQTGPCAACNKPVTVPFAGGGIYTAGAPASAGSGGGGMGVIIAVLAVVLIGGLLLCGGLAAAILFPAMGAAKTAAARQQSSNNLRQIGIAIHNYHDTCGELPPAIVTDASGKPLYSGMVLLLPFLEQQNLYSSFDKTKAWDDPVNQGVSSMAISTFVHPANKTGPPGHSDYLLVGGPNAMLSTSGKSSMSNVIDGTSNTIMAVEVAIPNASRSWAEPRMWDATQPFDGPDNMMVNVLFGDGSVRTIPKSIPIETLRLIVDRQDGQVVNLP